MTGTTDRPPRVAVYVTEGCHLCEDACAVVAAVCEDLGVPWQAVDLLTQDPETIKKWREYVPVTTIDGDTHDIFRVSDSRLRAALS